MQELFKDKGELTDVGLALLHFLMISILWVMTLICLLDQNIYRKRRQLHLFNFGLLIVWSILVLISQPLVIKIYALLSVVAVIVVEAAMAIRRKKSLPKSI